MYIVVGDSVVGSTPVVGGVVGDTPAVAGVVGDIPAVGGVVGSSAVGSGVMNGEIGGIVTSVSSSSVNRIIENVSHTHKNNYIY